ncbi:hypothetical protein BS47DRAFT_1368351 [Hydnum rufescens UP504]|uniref:Uncharacterized protein n=1 Tax=Hydnum rufescens UP504 TaxID=1448309 RepID=A0A9P6DNX3_9AGAM|nr:hypothetical protein BS47DRAFT_1368351 [Hydnum rufescens UP504]
MHNNWPKFQYLGVSCAFNFLFRKLKILKFGPIIVFIIYPYGVGTAPNWVFFQARKVFSLCKTLIRQMHRQDPGEIWARVQPPNPEPARQPTKYRTTHPPRQMCGNNWPPPRCMKPHPTRTQQTKNGHAQPPTTRSKNPGPEHPQHIDG